MAGAQGVVRLADRACIVRAGAAPHGWGACWGG